MSTAGAAPHDARALIAIDLGAESCRVSLLRHPHSQPVLSLVHRFPNAPIERDGHLFWDLDAIEAGVDLGLRRCAELAAEGVRSIAVDGWAVDYVPVDVSGQAIRQPFCYRDPRNLVAMQALHRLIAPERLRRLTGLQLLSINTLYQLHADRRMGLDEGYIWLNLPEYLLTRLGGDPVAERTNATHTQLIDLHTGQWSPEIFTAAGLDLSRAPILVPPGSIVGRLSGALSHRPAFRDTVLIAPACHDTASAIAGIPATGSDWAYISSGTWSLVGTLLDQPHYDPETARENFTNLGAVGGRVCFHKSVNGMWILKQCMEIWAAEGHPWVITDLIRQAELLPPPGFVLDVDDPELLLAGRMPQRINAQLLGNRQSPLDESPQNAPAFANLIFHGLAARYAVVLRQLEQQSGKRFRQLILVGGASRNAYLNRLTQQATGLPLSCGSPESSTVGNFAVQLALLDGNRDPVTGVIAEHVRGWAAQLCRVTGTPSPADELHL